MTASHRLNAFAWLLAASVVAAAPAAAAAEAYFPLEKLKLIIDDGGTPRLLIVELTLAVSSTEQKEQLRGVKSAVQKAVAEALGAQPAERYIANNMAELVKTVARPAAQKAAGDIRIDDALVRHVQIR